MSTTTGPGRPLLAMWKASCSTLRQFGDVLHQVVVLGAGPRDADGVAFLEGVVADEMGRHLSGDADDRDGVAERIGQAGDRVGGAGTRGHQHAADLAGRARIAFGRMHGALLVPHQNVLHAVRLLEQRVVDRQHRAARIAENVLRRPDRRAPRSPFRRRSFPWSCQLHVYSSPCASLGNQKGPRGPCTAHRQSPAWPSHPRRCASLRGRWDC